MAQQIANRNVPMSNTVTADSMNNEQKDDRILAQKAKKGDGLAYAKLFNRYKDTLYYMVYKMVNNKSDAEDLTAEAFDRAFRNLHQYDPKYAFSTWLFSIASNHSIDFLRKHKAKQASESQVLEDTIQSTELNPEEVLISQQQIAEIRELLKQLRPEYQTMLELRYFKGYSYNEIAEEQKIPLGTVKTQLARAKAKFGELIKSQLSESIINHTKKKKK